MEKEIEVTFLVLEWVCALFLVGEYSVPTVPAGEPQTKPFDEKNDNHDPERNDLSKPEEYICSDFIPFPNTGSLTFP